MADDAQWQGKGKTEGCENQHDDDAAGKDEVLQQHPSGTPRVAEQQGDVFQAVAHQDDVGGFHRHIGAGGSHGDSDVGHREGGGVVHAVADHHDGAFFFELADDVEFVLGQEFGEDFVDLGLLGDGLGDEALVAGEHDDFFHAEAVQVVGEEARGGADGVGHDQHGLGGDGIAIAGAEPDAGFAFRLERERGGDERCAAGGVEFKEQALAANDVAHRLDGGFRAFASGGLKVGGQRQGDREIGRAFDNGVGEGMFGLCLECGGGA